MHPFLLGRDRVGLEAALSGLERLGLSGEGDVLDASDLVKHRDAIARAFERADGFDVVVLAVGVLGGQDGVDSDRDEALEVMEVDFVGCGSLLIESLRQLRERGRARIRVARALAARGREGRSGASSVAAERRASNAIYGAAKAGLDSLAQGLGDACADSGVRVLVVRPGFVLTRMTAGLKPAPMATTPEAVAEATVRALDGGAHTVWVPGRLRILFAVLRHLPRTIWRRLPL